MGKKLFLHIGVGKTGTTAVQSFLAINNNQLHKVGFHYMQAPKWGDNSHHLLGFALWKDSRSDINEVQGLDRDVLFDKMSKEINSLPENINNVIISSEILFDIATTHLVEHLKSFINQNFEKVKIICYLRRQDEHIQSLYQHWVKANHTDVKGQSISEFIETFNGDDYFSTLNDWSKHFGKNNVEVKVYDKTLFKGKTIFSDFSHSLGINDISHFEFPKGKQSNISINPEATEILRLCPDLKFEDLVSIWPSATKKTLTGYSLLTQSQKDKILEKYEDSNRNVAIQFLDREDGILFNTPENSDIQEWISNNEMPFEYMVPTLISIFQDQYNRLKEAEQNIEALSNELNNFKKEKEQSKPADKFIYQLNKQTIADIKIGNDIKSFEKRYDEIEIESNGKDPCFFIHVPFETNSNFQLKLIIESSVNTKTQIFFLKSNEESYNEKNSVIFDTYEGLNEHVCEFSQNNLSPKVRIDPSNTPGKFTIKLLNIIKK